MADPITNFYLISAIIFPCLGFLFVKAFSGNSCLKRIESKLDGYMTGHDKWGDEAKGDIQRRLQNIEDRLNQLTLKLL